MELMNFHREGVDVSQCFWATMLTNVESITHTLYMCVCVCVCVCVSVCVDCMICLPACIHNATWYTSQVDVFCVNNWVTI